MLVWNADKKYHTLAHLTPVACVLTVKQEHSHGRICKAPKHSTGLWSCYQTFPGIPTNQQIPSNINIVRADNVDTVCRAGALTSIKENSKQIAFHGAAFQCNYKYHYTLGPAVSASHISSTKTPLDVLPYRKYCSSHSHSASSDSLAVPDEEGVFPRAQLSRGSSHHS